MANRTFRIFFCFAFVLMALACTPPSFNSRQDLLMYLRNEDNGYHFEKSVNSVLYSLTYRPTDLMISQFMDEKTEPRRIQKLRKKYSKYLYLNLGMSSNGKELLSQNYGSRAEFGAKVSQLAFGMSKKMTLTSQNRDTLPLLDYVYPRMYGMSTSTEMLLVYENKPNTLEQDYLLLSIRDIGFGTGEVSFKIDTKKIKNQPTLKF